MTLTPQPFSEIKSEAKWSIYTEQLTHKSEINLGVKKHASSMILSHYMRRYTSIYANTEPRGYIIKHNSDKKYWP